MICFLHASDLHLGKPFGGFPEDVRARLRQARQDVIGHLAQAARDGGASHVLLAGDTFDQETPAPTTVRHALNAMAAADDLTWVILPGNHDSLAAAELWRMLTSDKAANVVLAVEAAPISLGKATLLPAPCTVRHPGRDLTEWINDAPCDDTIRIGLAHGGVTDFRSGKDVADGPSGVIAPDRAALAGLDYLALGDWHGQLRIGAATWYCGTPEPDSFKAQAGAGALLVRIAAAGAAPQVTPVQTNTLSFQQITLDLLEAEDAPTRLSDAMPPLGDRAVTLLDVAATGRTSLTQRNALEVALADTAPDFLWHRADLSDLRTTQDTGDLDLIDTGGALRVAADVLAAEARDAASHDARRAAEGALSRLFSYRMDAE